MATDTARRPGIRLLLADDHAVVRRGLRMVLESEGDMQVVCEAGDADLESGSVLRGARSNKKERDDDSSRS